MFFALLIEFANIQFSFGRAYCSVEQYIATAKRSKPAKLGSGTLMGNENGEDDESDQGGK